MTPRPLALVGDGIENPWNARTMLQAAAMFNSPCLFRDRCELAQAWTETVSAERALPVVSREVLVRDFSPIVAVDNVDGADSIYGFRIGGGAAPAVVVGNERRGLAEDLLTVAHHAVQIPMVSRKLNCLNVAAASAVALYYMSRGGGGKLQLRNQPNKRRPELLLMGAADHVELGSSIRSAGAFGWGRIFVDDRQGVWFGRDRRTVSEGRAAARRQRNPIRVTPMLPGRQYAFAEASVITLRSGGVPLHQADLARGPSQVIVIPDEATIDLDREDWTSVARDVKFVQLSVPGKEFAYHYRLIASIALAEAARQVGQQSRPGRGGRPKRQEPLYDRSLKLLSEDRGEIISLEELESY